MDELLETDFAVAEKDRLYRCLYRLLEHRQEPFAFLKQKWAHLLRRWDCRLFLRQGDCAAAIILPFSRIIVRALVQAN